MSDIEVKESGKLEEKPALPRMMELLKTNFKGVMIFVRGKERKSFVFDEGRPMILSGNLKESILGKDLFDKKIITAQEFNKIKEVESSGKSFYDSALEVAGSEKVSDFVLDPWKKDIETIASWDIGQFASVEMMPKDMVPIPLPKPMAHYIFNALIVKNQKRKPKFSPYVRFEIDGASDSSVNVDHLSLNDLQKKVFDSLKESKTTKLVAQDVKVSEAEVSPIVFALREVGIVRADSDQKKKTVAQAAPSQTPSQQPRTKYQEITRDEKADFMTKLEKIDELDHFALLGIPKTASTKEVQDSYFSLAKKYHPDRLKNSSLIDIKDAERLFTKITEAYNVLSNPMNRKAYEQTISQSAIDHENLMNKIMQSEQMFLDGVQLLNRGQFKEASEFFVKARDLYDQEPEYKIKLGWSLFRLGVKESNPTRVSEGKKMLQDAFSKGYHIADVSYYLGMISKQENNTDQAMKYFRNCISADPNYALAVSELRVLERKEAKGGKKK